MTNIKDAVVPAGKKRGNRSAKRFIWAMLIVALFLPSGVMAQQTDTVGIFYNLIPSQYKPYAVALGQRLRKSGKERITAKGYLAYSDNLDEPQPVEIIWQYPLKVLLTQGDFSQAYDMTTASFKAPADPMLADTVEVLLGDSAEGLLSMCSTTGRTRYIGSGFVLPRTDIKGSGIDIVQMTIDDAFQDGRTVVKSYWFNSVTKLLGFVGYQTASGNQVDVIIDDWQDVGGEKVPFLIERWENGKLVLRFTLASATVAAAANDGTFGGK